MAKAMEFGGMLTLPSTLLRFAGSLTPTAPLAVAGITPPLEGAAGGQIEPPLK